MGSWHRKEHDYCYKDYEVQKLTSVAQMNAGLHESIDEMRLFRDNLQHVTLRLRVALVFLVVVSRCAVFGLGMTEVQEDARQNGGRSGGHQSRLWKG